MTFSSEDIRKHYLRDGVKEVLLEATELDNYRQAMITGHKGWYREKRENDRKKLALKPFKDRIYQKQVKTEMDTETRALYWSTNLYEPKVFREWIDYEEWDKDKVSKPGGYGTTGYYRLGYDIDLLDADNIEELEEDRDIMNAEPREMIEKALQFICDWFNDHGLSYEVMRPYFSGNGGYFTLSPDIVKLDCDPEKAFKICEGFNALGKQLEKKFFEEVEDADKFVKFDCLNNASRAWKTILSIHKSKPLACIPLDPKDIEIEILAAGLPLPDEAIQGAKEWIKPVSEDRSERNKYTEKLGDILNTEVVDRGLFEELLDSWGDDER